ncbi:MAG: DUF1599 domain-containing protein [Alloprevotella sp.]|nr:DUF1599 domain-containing protein [Alloprevotella sp.]
MQNPNTEKEFRQALAVCRALFASKLKDYGTSWRILRPASLTDQLYIKAARARTLQTCGTALVNEDQTDCFIAIVNYALVGLIQTELGAAMTADLSNDVALSHYDRHAEESLQLMLRKNHDYGEAWREMRVSSFTDIILQKIFRTKQIEDHDGHTQVSEGIASNYQDMLNYAVFALIKLGVAKAS